MGTAPSSALCSEGHGNAMGQVWCLLVASESDALASKAHPQIDPQEVLVALSSVGTAWDSLSVGQELQPNATCKRMTLSQFPTR